MSFANQEFKSMRDMLIRIDENTKNFHASFDAHVRDDASEQALVRQSLNKVHDRLDVVKQDLVKDKEEVKKELGKSIGFQNRILGGIALLTFIVPIIVAFYIKHN